MKNIEIITIAPKMHELLQRAVNEWLTFDTDEPVNGGDLVDWFAEWRAEVRKVLGTGFTFDEALEAFKNNPSIQTASILLDTAEIYHDDDAIGDVTYINATTQVRIWMRSQR